MDIKQQPLTMADLPFFMEELAAGARTGNFSNNFLDSRISKPFEKQMRAMLKAGDGGQHTGHYCHLTTSEPDGRRLGFIWLNVIMTQDHQPGLELRALCISKQFRGKGIASTVLDNWLDTYSEQRFQARCYAKSTQMIEMLKRRGFYIYHTDFEGSVSLARDTKS